MKILMVNDYGYRLAGTETHMFELKKVLEENGNIVKIFSSNWKADKVGKNIITCRHLPEKGIRRYLGQIRNKDAEKKMQQLVNDFQPDIVHCHNIFYQVTPAVLKPLRDVPTVMTVHDYTLTCPISVRLNRRTNNQCLQPFGGNCRDCLSFLALRYSLYRRKRHKRLLQNVDLFIAPSKFMAKTIELNNLDPVEVVYNGIDLDKLTPIKHSESTTAIFVGRLTWEKGLDYLLSAQKKVLEKINSQLIIIGDGPHRRNLEKMAERLGLGSSVKFLGRVSDEVLEEERKNARYAVIPSIWPENCSMVILEFLALGKPIITTDMGGNPELVEDGRSGFVVKPCDSDELAERMVEIFESQKIDEIGKYNRRKAEENHDLNKQVKRIKGCYSRAIE